ncbi:MAG TPA: hypothetical protein VHI13_00430 [Candidatus Kapabacteria bacterium]|nr:hypothetical protein [Candidatus Kapabacteria bacterium]
MDWTPENIKLLRLHLGDTQPAFARRVGVRRYQTVHEWEAGKIRPSGTTQTLLNMIANDAGFTERVAARLREKLRREEGE